MARVIVVTSGKGGVGKTTSSAAIASGLSCKRKENGSYRLSILVCVTSILSWAVNAAWFTTSST